MQPHHQPTDHDGETLLALERAVNDAVATLKVNDPFRDWAKDGELRTKLAERLFALLARGVTDPDELRMRALESLKRPQNSTLSVRTAGF